jgi:TolB-like protein/Flp pilus assembly protein TadD
MPSIVPGFEYDIFVSYRQKDNKYDGWVTEFVSNLRRELEATFKEDVSLYFDENPHDGLLDTHHVDKSLEGKLRCLIFIPILSRTYCDPRSFAWNNEFLAFLGMAKADPLGMEVQVSSGNITSRILPIRIYDLDPSDQGLFERETGSALRAVDFIFRSAGVNRPLKADDSRADNQAKTYYRDQVNKVANAIKGIVEGAALTTAPIAQPRQERAGRPGEDPVKDGPGILKELVNRNVPQAALSYILLSALLLTIAEQLVPVLGLPEQSPFWLGYGLMALFPLALILAWKYERGPGGFTRIGSPASQSNPYSPSRKKPLTGKGLMLLLGLLVVAQWFYFRNRGDDQSSPSAEKSIAVLPFENRSADESDAYVADGLTDDLITRLSVIADLRVISRGSIQTYRGQGLSYGRIASELGVSTLLIGGVQRSGSTYRISAQLIEGSTSRPLWSTTYTKEGSDVLLVQAQISQRIANVLKVRLSEIEKDRLGQLQTGSLSAYDYYLKGRDLYRKLTGRDNENAVENFRRAIALDPEYSLAWAGLADAYSQMHMRYGKEVGWIDSGMRAASHAIRLDPMSAHAYKALANGFNYKKRYDTAFKLLKKAVDLNPGYEQAVGNLGVSYFLAGDFVESLLWEKRAAGLNPRNAIPYQIIGWTYRLLGDLSAAETWLNKSLELDSNLWDTYELLAYVYVGQGRKSEALRLIPEMMTRGEPDTRRLETAGIMAHYAGDRTTAREYFRRSIELNESYQNDPNTTSPVHLGQLLLEEGRRVEAEVLLAHASATFEREISEGSQDDGPPFNLAAISAIRGDRSACVRWLRKAVEAKWVDYAMVTDGPWFANFRNDAEVVSIVAEVKGRMEEQSLKAQSP